MILLNLLSAQIGWSVFLSYDMTIWEEQEVVLWLLCGSFVLIPLFSIIHIKHFCTEIFLSHLTNFWELVKTRWCNHRATEQSNLSYNSLRYITSMDARSFTFGSTNLTHTNTHVQDTQPYMLSGRKEKMKVQFLQL